VRVLRGGCPMSPQGFPAPVAAPAPQWTDEVPDWEWDDVDRAWTRELCRGVGEELSGVQINAMQTATADGVVHTHDAEVVLGSAVVYVEEIDALIAALTDAQRLLKPVVSEARPEGRHAE